MSGEQFKKFEHDHSQKHKQLAVSKREKWLLENGTQDQKQAIYDKRRRLIAEYESRTGRKL